MTRAHVHVHTSGFRLIVTVAVILLGCLCDVSESVGLPPRLVTIQQPTYGSVDTQSSPPPSGPYCANIDSQLRCINCRSRDYQTFAYLQTDPGALYGSSQSTSCFNCPVLNSPCISSLGNSCEPGKGPVTTAYTSLLSVTVCTCLAPCATCDPTDGRRCATCKPGYLLQPTGICTSQCDAKCFDCNTALSICNKCYPGNSLYNNTCVSACPVGYFSEPISPGSGFTKCSPCDPTSNLCANCTSATQCIDCLDAANSLKLVVDVNTTTCLPATTVTCPSGTLANYTTKTCSACHASCGTSCSTPFISGACLDCPSGKYLVDGYCIDCPSGQYKHPSTGLCTPCADSVKCKACNATNPAQCLSCANTPTNLLFNGLCYVNPACPFGSIPGNSTHCFPCEPGCNGCLPTSTALCMTCQPGYYASGGSGGSNTNTTCGRCNEACSLCSGNSLSTSCHSCANTSLCLYTDPAYGGDRGQCLDCVAGGDPYTGKAKMNVTISGVQLINLPVCYFPCKTCSAVNPNQCTSCYDGKLFNPGTATCTANCSSNCVACMGTAANCSSCDPFNTTGTGSTYRLTNTTTNLTSCVATPCPTGTFQYASSGTCEPCVSNCLNCSAPAPASCYSCAPGYLLDPYNGGCVTSCSLTTLPSFLNGTVCSKCDPTCGACTSSGLPTGCTSCTSGSYHYPPNGTCISSCPVTTEPFYANSTSNRCVACDASCATCDDMGNGTNSCTSCPVGKFLLVISVNGTTTTSSCVTSCPAVGYFGNSTSRQCQACTLPCKSCTGSTNTSCSTCISGFSYFPPLNTCYPNNNPGCPSSSGYVANSTVDPIVCVPCHASCATCNGQNSSSCLTCPTGKFITNILTNRTCTSTCPTGTYGNTTTGRCEVCASQCDVCTGPQGGQCTACSAGFYYHAATTSCLSSTFCTAITGYYVNTTMKTCAPCATGCNTCTGGQVCTVCATGYSILASNTTCLLTCPPGYYTDNSTQPNLRCLACNANCKTCDGALANDCTSCQVSPVQYFLDPAKHTCVAACPTNGSYGDTSTGKCEFCASTACKTCLNATACTSCIPGSTYSASTMKCSVVCSAGTYLHPTNGSCVSSCPQYYFTNSTSKVCQFCPEGNFVGPTGDSCVPCASTKCARCSDAGSSNCTICKTRTRLAFGVCVDCHSSCETCDLQGQFACYKCRDPTKYPNTLYTGLYKPYGPCTQTCHSSCNTTTSFGGVGGCYGGASDCGCQSGTAPTNYTGGTTLTWATCGCNPSGASPYCATCSSSNPNSCLTCTGGTSQSSGCTSSCPTSSCKSCLTGISSSCLDCKDGYYDSDPGSGVTCSSCQASCGTCSNSFNCDTCFSPSIYKHVYGDNLCYTQCPFGYYADPSPAVPICSPCPSSCARCVFNSNKCDLCPVPNYLDSLLGTCGPTCRQGTYRNNATRTCLTGTSNCKILADNTGLCEHCNPGYYRATNGVCVTSCPQGTFVDTSYNSVFGPRCTACYTGCSACVGPNANDCTNCTYSAGGAKYYLNIVPGSVGSNSTCLDASTCAKTMGFPDDTSKTCYKCSERCAACTGPNPNQCTSCQILADQNIILDPQTGSCINAYTEQCSPGSAVSLYDRMCMPCSDTCSTCDWPYDRMCASCKPGYFKTPIYYYDPNRVYYYCDPDSCAGGYFVNTTSPDYDIDPFMCSEVPVGKYVINNTYLGDCGKDCANCYDEFSCLECMLGFVTDESTELDSYPGSFLAERSRSMAMRSISISITMCVPLPEHCIDGIPGVCLRCEDGYWLNTTYGPINSKYGGGPFGTCVPCASSCVTGVDAPGRCSWGGEYPLCDSCPDGTVSTTRRDYYIEGVCACPFGCESCNRDEYGNVVCDAHQCHDGFSGKRCEFKCPDGYASCDAETGISCKQGYYSLVRDNRVFCVDKCSDGFTLNGTSCVSPYDYCATYDPEIEACRFCYPYVSVGHNRNKIPVVYYPDIGRCELSLVPSRACRPGYAAVSSKETGYQICIKCEDGCESCEDETLRCTQPSSDSYISSADAVMQCPSMCSGGCHPDSIEIDGTFIEYLKCEQCVAGYVNINASIVDYYNFMIALFDSSGSLDVASVDQILATHELQMNCMLLNEVATMGIGIYFDIDTGQYNQCNDNQCISCSNKGTYCNLCNTEGDYPLTYNGSCWASNALDDSVVIRSGPFAIYSDAIWIRELSPNKFDAIFALDCDPSCMGCFDEPTYCRACAPGYYMLNDLFCVQEAPVGAYLSKELTIVSACPDPNCAICNETNPEYCMQCNQMSAYDNTTGTCILCEPGTYFNHSTYTCEFCNFPCKSCILAADNCLVVRSSQYLLTATIRYAAEIAPMVEGNRKRKRSSTTTTPPRGTAPVFSAAVSLERRKGLPFQSPLFLASSSNSRVLDNRITQQIRKKRTIYPGNPEPYTTDNYTEAVTAYWSPAIEEYIFSTFSSISTCDFPTHTLGVNNTCIFNPAGCMSFDITMGCVVCETGHFLFEGVCYLVSNATINPLPNHGCPDGHFSEQYPAGSDPLIYGLICRRCPEACPNCTNYFNCSIKDSDNCNPANSTYVSTDVGICYATGQATTCPPGTFFKTSSGFNSSITTIGFCEVCPFNTITAQGYTLPLGNATVVSSCSGNGNPLGDMLSCGGVPELFHFNGTCWATCPRGHRSTGYPFGTCEPCQVTNCSICSDDPAVCIECMPSSSTPYLDPELNVCVSSCPSHTGPYEIDNVCYDCGNLDGAGTIPNLNITTCYHTIMYTQITGCSSGSLLVNPGQHENTSCVPHSCDSGQYYYQASCYASESEVVALHHAVYCNPVVVGPNYTYFQCNDCHESCYSCTAGTSTSCTACNGTAIPTNPYFLASTGECVSTCPAGTAADPSDFCAPCQSGCAECADLTLTTDTCYSCTNQYDYLDGSTCNDACSGLVRTSYVTSSPVSTCEVCEPDTIFVLVDASGAVASSPAVCLYGCPLGYGRTSPMHHECAPCETTTPHCATCATDLRLSLTPLVCSSCLPGYLFSVVDKQCHPGPQCPPNQILDIDETTCLPYSMGCPSGSVLSPLDNQTCVDCSVTTQDMLCLTCQGASFQNCTSCQLGYYLYQGTRCINDCPSGFYANDTLMECLPCKDAHCEVCNQATGDCILCEVIPVTYLLASDGLCHSELSGCPSVGNEVPFIDPVTGYGNCLPCDTGALTHCATCDIQVSNCTSCAPGYHFLQKETTNGINQCVEQCPTFQYADTTSNPSISTCAWCSVTFSDGCMGCNETQGCYACDPWSYEVPSLFSEVDGLYCAYECPSRTYLDSQTGKCESCPNGCMGRCGRTSPSNPYVCESCDIDGLESNYTFISENGTTCLTQCEPGSSAYSLDEPYLCLPCPLGCESCISATTCTTRQSPLPEKIKIILRTRTTNPMSVVIRYLRYEDLISEHVFNLTDKYGTGVPYLLNNTDISLDWPHVSLFSRAILTTPQPRHGFVKPYTFFPHQQTDNHLDPDWNVMNSMWRPGPFSMDVENQREINAGRFGGFLNDYDGEGGLLAFALVKKKSGLEAGFFLFTDGTINYIVPYVTDGHNPGGLNSLNMDANL